MTGGMICRPSRGRMIYRSENPERFWKKIGCCKNASIFFLWVVDQGGRKGVEKG